MAQEDFEFASMCKVITRKISALTWFLRITLITLSVCFAIMALLVIWGRIAYPQPACLNIESYETDILDPVTGKILTISQHAPMDSANFPSGPSNPFDYSSNGKRLAYLADDNRLQTVAMTFPPLTRVRRDPHLSNPLLGEVEWSPDDQWIAYRWKDNSGKQYLAIADPEGHERNAMTLEMQFGEEVQLAGWSADSRYIAIINQDGNGDKGRVRFLSVPDLKLFDPGELGKTLKSGCEGPESADPRFYCHVWASEGHNAAYVIDKADSTGNLLMLDLDNQSHKIFPLPAAQTRTVRISPDGQSVLVSAFSWAGTVTPLSDAQFEIYSANGTTFHQVDHVALANLGGAEGPVPAEMAWSANSKFIVYAQHTPSDHVQIMLFRPETGEKKLLLSNLPQDDYDFAPSSDGKDVAVFPYYKQNGGQLRLVQIDGAVTRPLSINLPEFPEIKWSPDGKLLAFTEIGDRNTITVKLIDQNGNEVRRFDGTQIDTLVWTTCR